LPVRLVSLDAVLNGSVHRYPCVVALGAFDGVHLGHQSILSAARIKARELGGFSTAFTFDRLPLEYLRPQQAPPLITLPETRFSLLEQTVDEVIVVPFNQQLTQLEANSFIDQVLIEGLGAVCAVVGFNYTFGRGAQGNVEYLQHFTAKSPLEVVIVPPVELVGSQVSSTRIRQHISAGEVSQAQALLGRPFRLMGQVVTGDARGRVLGYPTANMAVDSRLVLPGPGVYITTFQLATAPSTATAETRLAVTAVSDRPTFSGDSISVESFVLDYERDLYGEVVYLDFHHRLRDIRKFPNAAELSAQIARDVEAARAYAKSYFGK
jgi:riboflavin kinase/FMN adenylyltransferase